MGTKLDKSEILLKIQGYSYIQDMTYAQRYFDKEYG
jgi:hypothetical protein